MEAIRVRLGEVARLVDKAVAGEPPLAVLRASGDYYEPYYYLMYLLARRLKRGLFVELGVEKGRGSACLALGAPKATVIGLDHTAHPETLAFQKELPNFTFIERPSLPALDVDEPIRILHIDTEHSYAMANEEFKAYQGKLAPGAVVLFDDLHAMEEDVARYFYSLPYPKLQHDGLHSCGYGVLVYE